MTAVPAVPGMEAPERRSCFTVCVLDSRQAAKRVSDLSVYRAADLLAAAVRMSASAVVVFAGCTAAASARLLST